MNSQSFCTLTVILHMWHYPLLNSQENKIELIALYPNATHIIQRLDVALFHPLKESYRKVLRQWRIDNNMIHFNKSMFAPVLKLALEAVDFSASIKNGFKACGLFPFDPNAVNYNILNKEKRNKNTPYASDNNDFSENEQEQEQTIIKIIWNKDNFFGHFNHF